MSGPLSTSPKNADFQTVEYWDKRYASEALDADFDWFRKYSDIRPVLIEKMQKRFPELEWRVMDIRELQEHAEELGGPGTWDVIIDKGTTTKLISGTMDALMAENGSVWNPSEQVLQNVAREVDGVVHLLKPTTGLFLYFTFGQPHFRRPHMQRDAWSIETRELGDMFHYYLYICRKH
ncbi:hypothetical protein MNAN1_003892 [Malassezia nana]|uniref:Uncharacterized protein n=1 Tax=Malassezia nana TaxID=180528 RepID=A0AAF0EUV7_9BASI|nr:hypothetical protein MNAN1_003892 [Malassezia nana]